MRILFCGSGTLAVPTLARIAAGHELAGVVTQPARPAGRGGRLRHTPLAEAVCATSAKGPAPEVIEAARINAPEIVAWVAARKPDVIVVADFGQMVRAGVRGTARLDTINLHASMLPELRGAAPVNWAIIRGYRKTGLSTFSLVDKLDAGPLYLQEEIEVRPDETAEELRGRCAEMGAALVCATLKMIEAGAKPTPQDESRVTLAPVLNKTDGVIDWDEPAETIRNLIHGTWPWPGGQAVYRRRDGHEVHVILARAAVEEGPHPEAGASGVGMGAMPLPVCGEGHEHGPHALPRGRVRACHPVAPGVIDAGLCVATGAGRLRVLQIKPAGGRLMNWRDFVNGQRVTPGDVFSRPDA